MERISRPSVVASILKLRFVSRFLFRAFPTINDGWRARYARLLLTSGVVLLAIFSALTAQAWRGLKHSGSNSSTESGGAAPHRLFRRVGYAYASYVGLGSVRVTESIDTSDEAKAAATSMFVQLNAPTNLTTTSTTATAVNLSWTAPGGSVDHYEIARSQSLNGPFNIIGTTMPDYLLRKHCKFKSNWRRTTFFEKLDPSHGCSG